MDFEQDVSLAPYNSLRLPARARYLCRVKTEAEMREALAEAKSRGLELLVLGGGSNLVLTRDLNGLALKIDSEGIETREEDAAHVLLKVAAGEDWPRLVWTCLERGFFGIENLTDIPGTAGAAPIQNIGAYGLELSQCLHSLEAIEIESERRVELPARECGLGYRDSRFKSDWRDRYLITSITLRLDKRARLRLNYSGIQAELDRMACAEPGPADVARAISTLRSDKLPDPARVGNVGSFFTNPLVSADEARDLTGRFPDLPCYPQADGRVKLAAAWLVERAGFKGVRRGPVGVSDKQALVLLHHGGGRGEQLLALAEEIQNEVERLFGIRLSVEPRILR